MVSCRGVVGATRTVSGWKSIIHSRITSLYVNRQDVRINYRWDRVLRLVET